jgi:ribonuclease Z
MPEPTYIVPPEIVGDVQGLLDAWRKLDKSPFPCKVVGLAPGARMPVGKGLQAQAFRTPHRAVASQGYALFRTKSKLKAEFAGVDGQEIGRLKRSGVQVTDEVETLELAWTSDTKAEIFEQEPWILQAERLILESTFVTDENSIEEAKLKGHTHLKEIIARADQLTVPKSILLTHFSARYVDWEIPKAMEQLPEGLKDRVQWITKGLKS